MVLVPRESLERLRGIQQLHDPSTVVKTVQTPGTAISRLDAEMSEILNSKKKLSDRDKWSCYQRLLERFLHFKETDDQERGGTKKKQDDTFSPYAEEKNEERKNSDKYIVESVPPKFRKNATNILKVLRSDDRLAWNVNGGISIDGVAVRGANMVDLINYAVRSRNIDPPAGVRQFAIALHDVGIPREFIGNKRLKRSIDEVLIGSPRLTSSSPKTASPAGTSSGTFFDASPPNVTTLITDDEDLDRSAADKSRKRKVKKNESRKNNQNSSISWKRLK